MELRDDTGPFWRDVELVAHHERVEADVADNVHHFTVTVVHDGTHVTRVAAAAIRVPWVTCPGATAMLDALVGARLADAGRAPLDQSLQCTHLLDLARLAIAQAHRGGSRRYACRIAFDPDRDVVVARLLRDRRTFVEWDVRNGRVVSRGPFFGHETVGRSEWSDAVRAEPDLREAGLILRRALFIYRSREDTHPRARAADTVGMEGVCYSFQPHRGALAYRPAGFAEMPAPQ